ncbi:hypothetical protein [Streptomyces sp. NPDC056061]|uniref:hypothetical protein n=1 Tax=Streptomyces sp. NPDC056061 TaxID=3345700 RepID=UPI0035E33176
MVEDLKPAGLQRPVLTAVALYIDRAVLVRQIAREEARRRVPADLLDGRGAAPGTS